METPTIEQRKVAYRLRKELKEAYPYVYPNIYGIEHFVMQEWARPERLTAHILYDFLISQGLCEVEK